MSNIVGLDQSPMGRLFMKMTCRLKGLIFSRSGVDVYLLFDHFLEWEGAPLSTIFLIDGPHGGRIFLLWFRAFLFYFFPH